MTQKIEYICDNCGAVGEGTSLWYPAGWYACHITMAEAWNIAYSNTERNYWAYDLCADCADESKKNNVSTFKKLVNKVSWI